MIVIIIALSVTTQIILVPFFWLSYHEAGPISYICWEQSVGERLCEAGEDAGLRWCV
jgi:hypothetical protein